MIQFNVYLKTKLIDSVFYNHHADRKEIYNSLVNHDGYDPNIRIVKPRILSNLKYQYIWVLKGNYGFGHGFEDLTVEETYKEIKQRLKEYRENNTTCQAYRIVRRREVRV